MKQLQKWFDMMAGISQDEQQRLAMAHAIFNDSEMDFSPLHTPACWRRQPQIRQLAQRKLNSPRDYA
ncbi:MAG: hypothetical protein PHT48_10830 [Dechloromonas sp.]|nr:hypothetical protein [Dechloromonas sp.]